MIQFKLAELVAEVDLLKHYNYACAEAILDGPTPTPSRDGLHRQAEGRPAPARGGRLCLQFHGGIGYMEETWTARYFRDQRLLSIGGGADEVMLRTIAQLDSP